LALTLLWDKVGLSLFPDNPVYSGAPRPWQHDFFSVGDRLTLQALLGNLCFVQTIWVPPLGSNDPLWSLSFEFWYYLLFPCGWLALFGKTTPRWQRALYAAFCAAGLLIVGKTIALYFPIWLLGTAIHLLPRIPCLGRLAGALTAVVVVLFGLVMGLTHLSAFKAALGDSTIAVDYVTAISFAVVLYLVLDNRTPSRRSAYAAISRELATFSYTLYVVHMPLLIVLRAALLPDEPWTPDVLHIVLAGLLALFSLAYAFAIARLTEGRTEAIRDWIWERLKPQPRPVLIDVLTAAEQKPALVYLSQCGSGSELM
jgi:peptidoglycan/LPS O-acetylase OafA/YrhL